MGRESPQQRITAAVAMPPTRICPSAPMFQKRILKAGVIASAIASRIIVSRRVFQVRLPVPMAPSTMLRYTWIGLLWVIR